MLAPSFNPAIDGLNPPPIPIVQKSAQNYFGQHGSLIDLSQAVPGYSVHPALLTWLEEAAGRTDVLGYGRIEGELALCDAYSAHVGRVYGAPVEPQEVHITSGCNQAFVAAALTLAAPGDSLLLVTPFYFNHDTTLSMLGIGTKTVAARPEDNFLVDPDLVAEAITPDVKAVVCVTPNNPTGAVYSASLLDALFDVCVSKNVRLVVDETYRDFLPEGQSVPHRLLQRQNWRDHFVGLYSFSKSFCVPGHRLGAITGGGDVIGNVAKVMDNLQICAPRPPQHAVARGLTDLTGWLAENRAEIDRRRETLIEVMAGLPDWELTSIGAYFSYVRHPFRDRTSIEAAEYLASERGVVSLPGTFFGEGQEPFLRFAFANATAAELRSLSQRLG